MESPYRAPIAIFKAGAVRLWEDVVRGEDLNSWPAKVLVIVGVQPGAPKCKKVSNSLVELSLKVVSLPQVANS